VSHITPDSKLDILRREAMELIPSRHADGDAAWVHITEGLSRGLYSADLSPAELARLATESLDAALAEAEEVRAAFQRAVDATCKEDES
jgi:hypothetical protein